MYSLLLFGRRASHAALIVMLMLASVAVLAADETFLERAGQGGTTEVAAGQLAQTRGASAAVKQFGAQMVADHTRTGDELKAIAGRKGMTVPTQPDAAQQKALTRLGELSGAEFDRAYRDQMVQAHEDTLALFEQQARAGRDADFKAFAGRALPGLRHHLDMAKALR